MVNVVTRSGTNELHGGAFEFVRNRVFNARNFFAHAADFLKRNQFGAYGGGPVAAGYNGRTRRSSSWAGRARASATARTTFDVRADHRRAQGRLHHLRRAVQPDRCAIRWAARLPEQPDSVKPVRPGRGQSAAVHPGGRRRRVASVSRATSLQDMDQGVAKVDHQLTTDDRLSVRYFIDHFDNAAIYNDVEPADLPRPQQSVARADPEAACCPGRGPSARRC